MINLNKMISTAKKIINLPYNAFNLENYEEVLAKSGINTLPTYTKANGPIQLMSGGHPNSQILRIDESNPNKKRVFLIGKGILFDSGGLNLKDRHMADMTNDKAGMIIALSIANHLKGQIVAYCPVTTNFIQTSKITPGDELEIGNKTVKIGNTDAEGRLILAEALSTIKPNKGDVVVTIATLTGCVAYAIGEEATGVFSENGELIRKYSEASAEAEELAWALPLWGSYQKKYYDKRVINNSVDLIKCGATEGALFIKQFISEATPFLHLDIAYSAFTAGKANGQPIKSLINFIRRIL